MPLSPHEENVLAGVERALRADDPGLAATFDETSASGAAPVAALPRFPLSAGHVLSLFPPLLGVVAAGALFADRPAVLVTVTVTLVVAWLVLVTRSVARRASAGPRRTRCRTGFGLPVLGVALAVTALTAARPSTQAVVGFALMAGFVLTSVVAMRIIARVERGTQRRR